MRRPSLRSNFSWTLLGSVSFVACQWLIVLVITKLGSASAVGDWTLALALTAPIFIFAQLKLRIVQTTDVRGENTWGEFFALRLLGSAAAMLASLAIVAVGYRNHTGAIVALIAVSKVFDGMSDLVYGQEQRREHMRAIAVSQTVRGVTSAAAAVALFAATRSTVLAALAVAVTYGAAAAWDLARVRGLLDRGLAPSWAPRRLGRLAWRVAPLGLVTAIGSLQANVPRYFLEGYSTRAELGVYAAIGYVAVMGNLVITAMAYASLPRMAEQVARGEWRAFRRNLARLMMIGFALGALGIGACVLVGELALRLLYSPEVAFHTDVLVWMAVNSTLLWTYMFLGTAMDAMRRFNIQPYIYAASTVGMILAAWRLVPSHGMVGAAWSMGVAYAIDAILFLVAVGVPIMRARDGQPRDPSAS